MKEFFSNIHYNHNLSFVKRLLKCILSVGVPFYYTGAQFKNFLYEKGILKSKNINGAYVISIGNITTGGVGKTPIVAQIANFLSENHKVAVISRGYGGKLSSKNINVIKNQGKYFYSAKECGDESFWLCENTYENVCVITCKDRVKASNYAVKELNCDVIVLDDAFQHRKIVRNLDVIVFDAAKLCGNGYTLPLGPLREPLFNVKRADKILITNKNLTQESFNSICKKISNDFMQPIIQVKFKPEKFYDIFTEEEISLENKSVGAFCGIGQPESFYTYLSIYNLKFVKTFDDHYLYSQKDIDNLVFQSKKQKVEVLVTTEKDAVKLYSLNFKNIRICAMKLGIDLNAEELLGEEV